MIQTVVSAKEKSTKDVEMIEGIVDISGSPMNVYSFFIDGTLIDTGSETLLELFKPWFATKNIERIFLTHNHEDHTAGVTLLQEQLNIPVYLHEDSIEVCRSLEVLPKYRQIVWGNRGAFQAQPFENVMQTNNYTWDIIYTPGHSQDHYSFYCRDLKFIFTGDLFVQPHTKVIMEDENLLDTIHSLKKLLKYDFEEVYCCHAGYLENGRELLQEKIRYLEEKQAIVKELYANGRTIEEIRKELFPKTYGIELYSDGQWSALHTVKSLLGI